MEANNMEKTEQELKEAVVSSENDAEETSSPVSHGGVTGDSYDMEPETPEEEADEFLGKEGIHVDYTFTGDEVRTGLKLFQKETVYKKNIIYSLILAAIFGVYMIGMATQGTFNGFTAFICVMCVSLIALIWYLPLVHVSKTAKAIDENPVMEFSMEIFDTGVRIREENGAFVLHYGKEITKVMETDALFLLCAGKERLFVVPKRCTGDDTDAVRDVLKAGIGEEKYLVKA